MVLDGTLERVILHAGPASACMAHALLTEHEEVMSLLIGFTTPAGEDPHAPPREHGAPGVAVAAHAGRASATVVRTHVLPRLDRRKDRVEISAEQLTRAAVEAERLSEELFGPSAQGGRCVASSAWFLHSKKKKKKKKKKFIKTRTHKYIYSTGPAQRLRVIGWMHSHPHITVEPSHVDVRTQGEYQMLDQHFFGVIVSCFDAEGPGMQIKAFQAVRGTAGWEKADIPLEIVGRGGPLAGAVGGAASTFNPSSPWPEMAALAKVLLAEERGALHRDLGLDPPGGGNDTTAGAGAVAVGRLAAARRVARHEIALCDIAEHALQPLATVLVARRDQVRAELRRLEAELDHRRTRMDAVGAVGAEVQPMEKGQPKDQPMEKDQSKEEDQP
jgi:proteasome lid subunit RPN8/RPN11